MTLADIEAVFTDIVMVAPDPAHSATEQRSLAIGRTGAGRYAFVVFTLRETDTLPLLRPISARYMHDKELKRYERSQNT